MWPHVGSVEAHRQLLQQPHEHTLASITAAYGITPMHEAQMGQRFTWLVPAPVVACQSRVSFKPSPDAENGP
jgi:hypothetical protein